MSNASTRTNQFAYDIIIEYSAEMTKATARSLMSVVISRFGTPLHHGFANYLDRGVHERGLRRKEAGNEVDGRANEWAFTSINLIGMHRRYTAKNI